MGIATAVAQQHSMQLLVTELHTQKEANGHKNADIAKCTWYEIKFNSAIESIQHSVDLLQASIDDIHQVLTFRSKSLPLYSAFLENSSHNTHLLVMSQTTPTLPTQTTESKPGGAKLSNDITVNPKTGRHFGLGYSSVENHEWSQTDSEVVVTFDLPPGVSKKEIYCVISRTELVVGLTDGTTFLRGELHAPIDTEGSTWTIDGDR